MSVTATAPAGQHTVRRHNTALVLDAITGTPGLSRAEVAARTGLTKATVSTVVDRLASAALIREEGRQPRSGPGRRGTSLSLAPDGPHGLGVEIAADRVATCLVGPTGELSHARVRRADNRAGSVRTVLRRTSRELTAALARAERDGISVGGIGIAVPGLVETPGGRVRVAPNLGWRDVDLVAELGHHVPTAAGELVVGNEANLAAVAELAATRAHGGGSDSFVHVSADVGIGAGIVLGGELFQGTHGFGGELGHFPVRPRGPHCSCGSRGCLERVAGKDAILADSRADDIDALLRLLEAADSTAAAAVRAAGRILGSALSSVVNLLDVPTIVLGGTYARLHPWLAGPLRTELTARVVSAPWRHIEVRPALLSADAAVRGAATSALSTVLTDPDSYLRRLRAS